MEPKLTKMPTKWQWIFFFKSYFKIKKLLAKGTTIAIQDANLNLRAVKLLTSNFNTFYSPQNKGLLTITPKDTLILDMETHKNNRIQKTVQIDKEKKKILLFNAYGPPSSQKKHKVQFLTYLDNFILKKNTPLRML